MNIFALHPDPTICASYHCDQHLHKMILESAQMLSTAARARSYYSIESWLYKSAYEKHPCTIWTGLSNHNMLWLCELASELDNLRTSGSHSSMDVIKAVQECIVDEFSYAKSSAADPFIFCGPAHLSLNRNLTVHEKYQAYYILKHKAWLDKGRGMSYKGRGLPCFLAEFSDSIPHSYILPKE